MNEDQIFVKMHLDPMFAICDFLNDFFEGQIKYAEESTAYKLSPAVQEAKLIALKQAKSKFKGIHQEVTQLKQQLLDSDALHQSSLDSVYPNFTEEARSLRNKLMQLFTVHSV